MDPMRLARRQQGKKENEDKSAHIDCHHESHQHRLAENSIDLLSFRSTIFRQTQDTRYRTHHVYELQKCHTLTVSAWQHVSVHVCVCVCFQFSNVFCIQHSLYAVCELVNTLYKHWINSIKKPWNGSQQKQQH